MGGTAMSREQFAAAASRLGLSGTEFGHIQAMNFEDGVRALDGLKLAVKKRYREVVLELHPDRTGNDPVKTEEFKRVTEVHERIQRLRLVRRPQVVPFIGHMNTTNTATQTYYGRVHVRVTVNVR